MGNLNELHVPPDADEATDFAARREFGLRYDSYREGLVRDQGLREIEAPASVAAFFCHDPEKTWTESLRIELMTGCTTHEAGACYEGCPDAYDLRGF